MESGYETVQSCCVILRGANFLAAISSCSFVFSGRGPWKKRGPQEGSANRLAALTSPPTAVTQPTGPLQVRAERRFTFNSKNKIRPSGAHPLVCEMSGDHSSFFFCFCFYRRGCADESAVRVRVRGSGRREVGRAALLGQLSLACHLFVSSALSDIQYICYVEPPGRWHAAHSTPKQAWPKPPTSSDKVIKRSSAALLH